MQRPVPVLLLTILLAGCAGSQVESTFITVASPTATVAATPTAEPTDSPLDPDAPLDVTFTTQIFQPAFSIDIPSDWVAVERDPAAFQVYTAGEAYELTIDSTYKEPETVQDAIARLTTTPNLAAGEVSALTVGGRDGLFFLADPTRAVEFSDSGFHTNSAAHMRIGAVATADGGTVTIFVVTPHPDFAELDELALRMLATVQWR